MSGDFKIYDENRRLVGALPPQTEPPVIPAYDLMPIGSIVLYGNITAPTGWLRCDWNLGLSKTTYPALFDVLGYTYGGSGDTFSVPNLNNRVPMGWNALADLAGYTNGSLWGAATHVLVEAEIPAHIHGQPRGTAAGGGSATQPPGSTSVGTANTTSTGGGLAHNNMQPTIVLPYIIKAFNP